MQRLGYVILIPVVGTSAKEFLTSTHGLCAFGVSSSRCSGYPRVAPIIFQKKNFFLIFSFSLFYFFFKGNNPVVA